MRKLKSCGIFCLRNPSSPEFLLMEHKDRLDLPKGHVDPGETELECAFREWHEETGIGPDRLRLVDDYRYETSYIAEYKRTNYEPAEKTLVIYAAWLVGDSEINLTEHIGFRWVPWNPPHQIQKRAIDPLLEHVCEHWTTIESVKPGSDEA